MKQVSFRTWVEDLWQENCIERDCFGDEKIDLSNYFNQYKWWLRREYRHQINLSK